MSYAQHYRGRKILVTGGAGAIGSNLVRHLASLGTAEVVVLDDLSSSQRWNVPDLPNVRFLRGSVLSDIALSRAFARRPQIVFHLAAFFANQNSIEHPARDLQVNGMGTLRTLQWALRTTVERVVYTSSSAAAYGEAAVPVTERAHTANIETPYQITKMLGEQYCEWFHQHHGLATVRARLFNSFGPGELPGRYRNVIPNFMFHAMQGRPLSVMGDGLDTRDWTFVDDIVEGLARAGVSPAAAGQVINLGAGRETPVLEIARQINEITGNRAGIQFIERRAWDRSRRRVACIDKAQHLLGYAPKVSIQDGLCRTAKWFRDKWDRIERCAALRCGLVSAGLWSLASLCGA